MRRLNGLGMMWFGCAGIGTSTAHAGFGRGAPEWTAVGGEAQHSYWVRTDPKISKDSLQKPGFALVWKVKLSEGHPLTPAVLLDRYIGYRGFRSLAFVGDNSGNVFGIDT